MFVQRLYALSAATVMVFSLGAYAAEPGPNPSAPEAFALVEAGKMTLIDIRRPEKWRQLAWPGTPGASTPLSSRLIYRWPELALALDVAALRAES